MKRFGVQMWTLALCATATLAHASEWRVETVAMGTKPDLALGAGGAPCIAYMIEDNSGSVELACRDQNGWDIEIVSNGYFYAPLDLVVDGDDNHLIAYHDHDIQDLAVAVEDDGLWVVERVASDGHDGWDPTIALEADGKVHVASIDPSQFGSTSGIEYAIRLDGSWQVEEIGSGPVPYEFGTAISVDGAGRPHIAYHNGSETLSTNDPGADLLYAVKEDDEWTIEEVDTQGDVGKFPTLALDADGVPHLGYLLWQESGVGAVRYATRSTQGWHIETVATVEPIEISHFGARRLVSLALGSDDRPWLAFSDLRSVFFATTSNGSWTVELVTEQTSSSFNFGQLVSLAVDADDRPHIGFYELPANPASSTGTVYYAVREDSNSDPPRVRRGGRRLAPSVPVP